MDAHVDAKQKMNLIPDDMDIVDVLFRNANLEMEVEKERQILIRDCEEFNTIDAFRVIDYEAKGFVDPHEMMKAL